MCAQDGHLLLTEMSLLTYHRLILATCVQAESCLKLQGHYIKYYELRFHFPRHLTYSLSPLPLFNYVWHAICWATICNVSSLPALAGNFSLQIVTRPSCHLDWCCCTGDLVEFYSPIQVCLVRLTSISDTRVHLFDQY